MIRIPLALIRRYPKVPASDLLNPVPVWVDLLKPMAMHYNPVHKFFECIWFSNSRRDLQAISHNPLFRWDARGSDFSEIRELVFASEDKPALYFETPLLDLQTQRDIIEEVSLILGAEPEREIGDEFYGTIRLYGCTVVEWADCHRSRFESWWAEMRRIRNEENLEEWREPEPPEVIAERKRQLLAKTAHVSFQPDLIGARR